MRKFGAAALFLCFVSAGLFSQSLWGWSMELGAAGLTGRDWQEELDREDWQNQLSLSAAAGLFYSFQLWRPFYVQPEIRLLGESFRYGDGDSRNWLFAGAVELPLHGVVRIPLGRAGRLCLKGGPQFKQYWGYGATSRLDTGKDLGGMDEEEVFRLRRADKIYDRTGLWGISCGIGYETRSELGFPAIALVYTRDRGSLFDRGEIPSHKLMLEIAYGFPP